VVAFQEEAREYEIKRKIFRDGENEYYMNGVSVRLKDIQDFLLGTGIGLNTYAIVEQGKVEYFTQMKPQERKVLLEEASGITRFEEKKREAIIRLEEVRANLERVGDISNEVANSLKKAEMEWRRWGRYKALTDRLAEIDRQMLVDGLKRLNKRIEKVVERQEATGRDIEAKEVERKALREEVERKAKELSLTDEATRELELYIKGKEKDMENRLVEIEYIKDERGRSELEKRRSEEQMARLLKRIAEEEETTERLYKESEEINAQIKRLETEALSSKQAMEGSRAEIDGYEKAVEEERVGLFVIMSSITDIKNRISEIERRKGKGI
jgi:chromosome segregation protein